jgi:hypothetical protein
MTEVSLLRLYILRALYLLIAVALGFQVWQMILDPARTWELQRGLVVCMLGSFSALSVLALRYPLQMLPLLMWEMAWKAIWLLKVALPLWAGGQMDAATAETAFEVGMVVIIPFAIPWRYVFANYVRKPGDPWIRRAPAAAVPA